MLKVLGGLFKVAERGCQHSQIAGSRSGRQFATPAVMVMSLYASRRSVMIVCAASVSPRLTATSDMNESDALRFASTRRMKPVRASSLNLALRCGLDSPNQPRLVQNPANRVVSSGFSSMKCLITGATSERRLCSRRIVNICMP